MSDLPHVTDLFDPRDLEAAIASGYVRSRSHPSEPLRILNYTEKAQVDRAWNAVTLACRGLILDARDRVVARPFRKFFNYGDPLAGELDLSAEVVVVDKLDGSLGVLYPTSAGPAVATRGSFTSDQATHATDLLRARYGGFVPPEGLTILFEIVYPGTRLVCDYGDTDDLFLLGAVETATGAILSPSEVPGWPGPSARVLAAPSLAGALALPPRPGAEGVVVRLVETGRMVKVKQADYLDLHRVLAGLNARVVWEALDAGRTVADVCEDLPDEFHGWVADLAGRLRRETDEIVDGARAAHERILAGLPEGWGRGDYAAAASGSEFRQWLFMLLDGRDPRPAVWRSLRPSGDDRPIHLGGETA
ncbi:RNA ligase [Streptosporangium becharense]|uniref:RNA ligase n=1 Tax=Streptosporangium becharense TaxID=1816182 RepID=A0A7W9IE43_9ACTN|nr:RNA ligase [Streptosporangium becharense]MBB2912054.1 RNA ligase [Streptosporangium becharense]MBB5818601.1 RNA ligase [Streptosporangium becharense]